MGRSCSEALNALVKRIVCAVGFLEAVCALLLPLVVLPDEVVFPDEVVLEDLLLVVLPGVVVLALGAGFLVVLVAGATGDIGVCVCLVVPLAINGALSATKKAAIVADRTLSPMVAIISLSFQPTSPL